MERNITFSLPADLIRRAKVLAAEQDRSLNALVRQTLEETVERKQRDRAAGNMLLRKARTSLYSIRPGSLKRDELYE